MLALALTLALIQPAHYLVFEMEGEKVKLLTKSQAVMDVSAPAIESDVNVRVLDDEGNVIHTAPVRIDPYLRAEFGPGPIEGQWLKQDRVTFAVRVPAGARVELEKRGVRTRQFALDPIDARRIATHATGHPNRIDLLIMGDGYTAADEAKFHADVERVTAEFFSIEPYSTYKNFVNVSSHFVASRQAGADHPNCADGTDDPLEGTSVDTAFDATFCTAGIQRLLTVNSGKVLTAAAAVPGWDMIMVVVNDAMYGGAGGMISVFSTNKQAVGIAQHEYGHSFTGLADEYTTPFPGFPACSDVRGPACEANVTDNPVRAAAKWLPWILESTPVPTPPNVVDTIGLFQGARYSSTAYYRPRHNCLMNILGEPFCAICRQAYVLRLYREHNISLIESANPAGDTIAAALNEPVRFDATLLQPSGAPNLFVQWLVDGEQVDGVHVPTFTYAPSKSGQHVVELRVFDSTSFVHPSMSGGFTRKTRVWTVNVSSESAPANLRADGSPSNVTLTWDAIPGATSYEVARSTGGEFTTIATVATNPYVDTSVSTDKAYVYRVRAGSGPYSNRDLATVFADGSLESLRVAIDAARAAAGLPPATYSSTVIAAGRRRAVAIVEMQNAVHEARDAIGLPRFPFTPISLLDPTPRVTAAHTLELRAAIR